MRIDLVFSYWIFFWFVLYYFHFTNYSPKFVILIGLFHNSIMLIMMLLYGTSRRTIIYFIIINTLIKLLPLYYLRYKSITWREIQFSGVIFIAFILWLHLNNQSLKGNLKLIYNSLLYGKNQTPFMSLLENIKNNFKTYTLF